MHVAIETGCKSARPREPGRRLREGHVDKRRIGEFNYLNGVLTKLNVYAVSIGGNNGQKLNTKRLKIAKSRVAGLPGCMV